MRKKLWIGFASGMMISVLAWPMLQGQGQGHEDGMLVSGVRVELEAGASQGEGGAWTWNGDASRDATRDVLDAKGAGQSEDEAVRVYISKSRTIERVTLEAYVMGVVAAEMPLDFELEALEAQALAARTYIIRRLWRNDRSGMPVKDADVTDTQTHQVYRSQSEMKKLQSERPEEWRRLEEAVKATSGEIIVYGDEPIEALFFSTSNGYTENSEEVFSAKLPYLRSVASPWDQERSPRAKETVEMEIGEFYDKLGVVSQDSDNAVIRILERTEGQRVRVLAVGNERLTGEEVRHLLGLRSADFDWRVEDGKVVLTTYGSGHGVGMSQWGAEGLAKAGKTARQIVEYYYSGARTEKVSKLSAAMQ